ncbi:MAG: hypothetical protein GY758_00965 [Fuerstiella sp.]|nr:hypothetical protein [Fuerstiella sp.]
MADEHNQQRRKFFQDTAAIAAGLAISGKATAAASELDKLKIRNGDPRADLPDKFNALVDYVAAVEKGGR